MERFGKVGAEIWKSNLLLMEVRRTAPPQKTVRLSYVSTRREQIQNPLRIINRRGETEE